MSTSWKIRKDGKEQGPINSAELKRMADAGAIKPFDLVQRNGQGDWYQASSVRGLFATQPASVAMPVPAVVPAPVAPPASPAAVPVTQPQAAAAGSAETQGSFWDGWGWGVGLILIGAVLKFAGQAMSDRGSAADARSTQQSSFSSKVKTRNQIESLRGKNQRDVIALLGRPDSTFEHDDYVSWLYYDCYMNEITGKADSAFVKVYKNGIVKGVSF